MTYQKFDATALDAFMAHSRWFRSWRERREREIAALTSADEGSGVAPDVRRSLPAPRTSRGRKGTTG